MDARIALLETSPAPARRSELTQLARHALDQAIVGVSRLPAAVLAIPGMSGRKYRYFINNLIYSLAAPRYLEIGSWAAVAIDNWSEFGGSSERFFRNLAEFKGAARVSFLEQDVRKVDCASLARNFGQFAVYLFEYLFDGPHTFQDQYDGITIMQPALESQYVQIVDDWNWPQVRNGTLKAIADLGLQIDFMAEIRTSLDDQHALPPAGEANDWHSGYCISVLSLPPQRLT